MNGPAPALALSISTVTNPEATREGSAIFLGRQVSKVIFLTKEPEAESVITLRTFLGSVMPQPILPISSVTSTSYFV